MKTLFITALLAITVASCNQKVKEKLQKRQQLPTNYMLVLCILKLLAKGSECPKCGMELTEKVAQGTATEKRTYNADEETKMQCQTLQQLRQLHN
jgi:hypothetical protein